MGIDEEIHSHMLVLPKDRKFILFENRSRETIGRIYCLGGWTRHNFWGCRLNQNLVLICLINIKEQGKTMVTGKHSYT